MPKNVLILFGGESNEHEISRISCYNVLNALKNSTFNIFAIGITKSGCWYLYEGSFDKIKDGSWENEELKEAFICPTKSKSGIIVLENGEYKFINIDVCFPVLHGKNGEDGTVQGLLTLAGIKYVGANVLSSALCMDKVMTKIVLKHNNIPQTPYLHFKGNILTNLDAHMETVKTKIGFPCFVKPANAGSSIGASKADDFNSLKKAIENAFLYDNKILVEKFINCREIEVAVLGNNIISIAGPGEIISDSEFYDYDTKYITNQSVKYSIPADISDKLTNTIREYAQKAYEALDCKGLSRIDFFIDKDNDEIYLNEINTMPGFTNISMYPKLFISEGIDYEKLVLSLIDLASL